MIVEPLATDHCPTCQERRKPLRPSPYRSASDYADPFCSAECCRRWYGLAPVHGTEGERRGGRIAAERYGA